MQRLIDENELRNNIIKESINLANTTFNIETINNQIGSLYQELIG